MAFNETVAQLAMAAYGRALANTGMDYYDNLLTEGIQTKEEILEEFMSNNEAAIRYPQAQSYADSVKQIFNNVLGRDPSTQAGIDHYSNLLSSGTWSLSDLVLQVLSDATSANGGDSSYLSEQVSFALNSYLPDPDDSSLSTINSSLGVLSTFSTQGVSSLASDNYWHADLDNITFSFNSSIPAEYYNYSSNELIDSWTSLSTEQEDVVRSIIEELNDLVGITIEETSLTGDIRFNIVDMNANTSGFSFFPGNDSFAGDIFLSSDFNTLPQEYSLDIGEWGYSTIVHELGHALGLKHPFEGSNVLATNLDDVNHSIMSYTNINSYSASLSFSNKGISIDYNQIQPSFYSLYDVAALQAIYGVNENTNTEDNIYTTSFTNYEVITIWDAGGIDTIDLSQTKGETTLDLRAGSLNSVDQYTLSEVIDIQIDIATQNSAQRYHSWIVENITDLYESDNLYTGIDNFAIATGVVIENITTGSGNDIITDNEVDNYIVTSAGNDKIYLGNGGNDFVDGGDGNDSLYLDLAKNQISVDSIGDNLYTLTADNLELTFLNIENIYLAEDIMYTPDMLI